MGTFTCEEETRKSNVELGKGQGWKGEQEQKGINYTQDNSEH